MREALTFRLASIDEFTLRIRPSKQQPELTAHETRIIYDWSMNIFCKIFFEG